MYWLHTELKLIRFLRSSDDWYSYETHLSIIFKENPIGKENDLYLVVNSISHPITRAEMPIAITITILDALQRVLSDAWHNY